VNDDTVLLLFICIFTHPPVFSSRKKREKREQREERNISFFDFYEPSGPSFSALFCFASLFQLSWFLSRTQKVPRFFFAGSVLKKERKKQIKFGGIFPKASFHITNTNTQHIK